MDAFASAMAGDYSQLDSYLQDPEVIQYVSIFLDFNHDGGVDLTDLQDLSNAIAGGGCPG